MVNISSEEYVPVIQPNSFDTIMNSNNASMYDKDTVNCSSCNIYETLTLCGSESDLFLGSVSGNANINENDPSSSSNALKTLQFVSLNVCGLKRRILFPEFSDLVSKYDLFCVCETKLDKYGVIGLPGYVFLSQCRKQKYICKSGWIGIFIKQTLSFHVYIIESDSDYVLWLCISKTPIKLMRIYIM